MPNACRSSRAACRGTQSGRRHPNCPAARSRPTMEKIMQLKILGLGALMLLGAPALAAPAISDAQIAHIAYTAGTIDVAAAKQALAQSHDKAVRGFAEEMVRDHEAV